MPLVLETNLPNLYYRGKVRDTYHLDGHLLMVASDRVSAFDSVLPAGIPEKGIVLTQLSAFWFERTTPIVPNHLVSVVNDIGQLAPYGEFPDYLCHRSMIVKRAERIDLECVVRGYLAGSAWVEYQDRGSVYGVALPSGMREAEELPEPLFTPTTKAESGHDQPITIEEMKGLLGRELAEEIREKVLAVYRFAAQYARERGIIIADTKMEFGLIEGRLHLIDELLTPDSSRFWDAASYAPGRSQPSFDKQDLRDWLLETGWNKEPPPPPIAPEVVARTAEKYREAHRRLTGRELPGPN